MMWWERQVGPNHADHIGQYTFQGLYPNKESLLKHFKQVVTQLGVKKWKLALATCEAQCGGNQGDCPGEN